MEIRWNVKPKQSDHLHSRFANSFFATTLKLVKYQRYYHDAMTLGVIKKPEIKASLSVLERTSNTNGLF